MGLAEKSKKVLEQKANRHVLTKIEIQFLLKLIGQSAFQGKDVQMIYDVTAKLQNQYMKQVD
tara:strand:- start:1774 stop:1959 length:186 start_codon:yes stop_codon:yes gene_type:complete